MRREEQWENKSIYVFYLELVTGKSLFFTVFTSLKTSMYIYFVLFKNPLIVRRIQCQICQQLMEFILLDFPDFFSLPASLKISR